MANVPTAGLLSQRRHRAARHRRVAGPGRRARGRRRRPGTLRVVIIAESFMPNMNGATNSVLRVVAELSRRGHECLVVAPGPGSDEVEGTPVVRVPSFEPPRVGDLRVGLPTARLATIMRSFRPDVVHLAAPAVLGAAGAIAARRLGLPTVAIYQTDLAGFARRRGMRVLERPIWRWLAWVHRNVDLTLAPSTTAMWTLRAHGIPSVAHWTRGVDLESFNPAARDLELRSLLAPAGEVIVGYVGRLAAEKQVHRLAAVDRLPGTQVVVVGDGPERATLERTLPNATFTGLRRGAELAALHASFDVFVHTGLDETFCQTVQEALASGVPVVAPASGGPLDLVRHGENGYLWDPARPESLLGAVSHLATSPAERARLGDAARRSVVDRPWSALTDELLDHYASVSASVARLRAAAA